MENLTSDLLKVYQKCDVSSETFWIQLIGILRENRPVSRPGLLYAITAA